MPRAWTLLAILLTATTLLAQPAGQPPSVATVAQLEQQVRDNPSLASKTALAEGYLRDCQLEKSLALWREVLAADKANERARQVIDRLTVQALDLDSHLAVLENLIDRGIIEGTGELLTAAGERAASDGQKAQIVYLRGRLAAAAGEGGKARASFESAMKLYPSSGGAAWSAIALAALDREADDPDQARHLLQSVIDDKKLAGDPAGPPARQQAMLRLALLDSAGLTSQEKTAALRDLLARLTDNQARRDLLEELIAVTTAGQGLPQGRWTPEAVDAAGLMLAAGPNYEQTAAILRRLLYVAQTSQDALTLDRLLQVAGGLKLADASLRREAAFIQVDATLSRAVVEDRPAEMRRLLATANGLLDVLANGPAAPDRQAAPRITQLRGRALLVEAQKLAVLQGNDAALPLLLRARDHFLDSIDAAPQESFDRLAGIGALLEQMREWETAVALYRLIATRFPQLPAGRDALLRVAQIHEQRLDAPVIALEVYAEYAGRYPAELPYRQLDVGDRLRRLGYANVLDFQKRNNLKPDGLFGPATRSRLAELENAFDLIRSGPGAGPLPPPQAEEPAPPPAAGSAPAPSSGKSAPRAAPPLAPIPPRLPLPPPLPSPVARANRGPGAAPAEQLLRGQYVHPAIFDAARRLEQAGRHRDAIAAYRLFINLFPTKKDADNALIAIARMFRDDLLFAEALGAYRQLMNDFPKGEMTSEAYVEAAQCLENLGRWKEARELYELYGKNFPKYRHAALSKTRIGLLDEILQYEDFIATNPASPKVAEAQYQIASILYKQFADLTKSAVEFRKVADRFPQHVRAPEALFTAGTAQLRAENFPAARAQFADLVARYPESRLADDGQYWIGHTYEYAARALGKLDRFRVVLKRRGLRSRVELSADLPLRSCYNPAALAGPAAPQVPEDIWGGDVLGVLTSGSKRDRVNADLQQAIRAYRKVVDDFKMGDMAGNALLRIGTIYTDYLSDPDKGVAAYQELLAHYPASKEAVNALFEVGAYQVQQKKFDEAIKSYQQFMYNYPTEPKVEDAMLAVARCHAEKKAWDKALDAYQAYLNKYPAGKHADLARAQVEWIRMYHF